MKKDRGFTLIEMLLVISIVVMMASFGVPYLNAMVQNRRVSDTAAEFIATLTLAQSQAAMTHRDATITATAPVLTNEFGGGWSLTSGAASLKSYTPLSSVTINSVSHVSTMRYNSRGQFLIGANSAPLSTAASFRICGNTGTTGRSIDVNGFGLWTNTRIAC